MSKEFVFNINNKQNWTGQKRAVGTALQIMMDNTKTSLLVKVGEYKEKKRHKQLRAFYECITQLLPQYNAQQLEQGKKEFFEDEFKFILKYVGGWFKTIENRKGETMPIEKSFKDITKEEMVKVLNNIQKWAIDSGFDLCIDEELRDFNEYYKITNLNNKESDE